MLVDQVDPDMVCLGVEVIERVELEAEKESVKVVDALLHDGQGRVEPGHIHAGSLDKVFGPDDAVDGLLAGRRAHGQ